MKTVSLSGSLRANVGSRDAAELRNKGMVPCVLYGGKEQIHFFTDTRNFKDIIFTPEVNLVEVEVDGHKYKSILQEAQYHKINDRLIHADFLQVFDDKPVVIELPVKPIGASEGVKEGGKLTVKMRKLRVRSLIKHLPESINLNVDHLAIGKSIAVGDIKIEGVEILNAKNVTVISVNTTRAVATEVTPAATTTAAAAKTPAAATPAPAAKTPAKK
jgi:large subunit ribosomal protein L25